jgi:hypothetical protein
LTVVSLALGLATVAHAEELAPHAITVEDTWPSYRVRHYPTLLGDGLALETGPLQSGICDTDGTHHVSLLVESREGTSDVHGTLMLEDIRRRTQRGTVEGRCVVLGRPGVPELIVTYGLSPSP